MATLRPAANRGTGSLHTREWSPVKRILDGRKAIPRSYGGRSLFHTSSVGNIAEVTRIALEAPQSRILNMANPSASSVAEIAAFDRGAYGIRRANNGTEWKWFTSLLADRQDTIVHHGPFVLDNGWP